MESHRENRFSARCVYSSDNCQELSIGLFEGENTGLCLDTENAEVHDEMINGKKAVIITKEGVSQLCLIDEKKGNYLLITGSMEQTDDLVKIAQNTVIDIYSDIGLPGHDLTRPELNRMKQAAEKGMFDAIFVVNRDRLFRGRWTEAPMFPVPIIVADEVRMKRKEEHLH